jgi:hypothetical protein
MSARTALTARPFQSLQEFSTVGAIRVGMHGILDSRTDRQAFFNSLWENARHRPESEGNGRLIVRRTEVDFETRLFCKVIKSETSTVLKGKQIRQGMEKSFV